MEYVLGEGAEAFARSSGFVQRRSKLSAGLFSRSLVLGWMMNPSATLEELAQVTAALGVNITPQGLDQRFDLSAAQLLQEVLSLGLAQVVNTEPVAIPLLRRFNGVYVCDSTVISLPACLSSVWSGLGNNRGEATAALKVNVRLNLQTAELTPVHLSPGREQDRSSPSHRAILPPDSLRLSDLGYFDLKTWAEQAAQGAYFLSRLRVGTCLFDLQNRPLSLEQFLAQTTEDTLDQPIHLGRDQRLLCRLLAWRVPQEVAEKRRRRLREAARVRQTKANPLALCLADWTLAVTNVQTERLSLAEAAVLLRARWQIELLFKLWKSHGRMDESRSHNPWRILCEVYAKLLAMMIQHWILLTACWRYPDRSLTKAIRTVQHFALSMAAAFARPDDLDRILTATIACLATGCRMNKRKKKPNAYQLLLNPQSVTQCQA